MTFLTPAVLMVAAIGTLVATALHFLSVRRPRVMVLPTARFVAPRDVRAVSRSTRPSDLLLLLLRVLALWCAALALAGPRWTGGARVTGHVVIADASLRADSARVDAIAGIGESSPVRFAWTDSGGGMRTELGAAWPLAWRATGSMLRDEPTVDSVAVHVVVPATVDFADGWDAWRRSWPGKVNVHAIASSVPRAGDNVARAAITVAGGGTDDVVQAAFDVHAAPQTVPAGATRAVRVIRSDSATGDGASAVTVHWPVGGVPAGWSVANDTAGALVAGNVALVAPWARTSVAPANTASSNISPAAGISRTIVWWSDGLPAAIERTNPNGNGCTRDVGIAVPNGSDVLLSPQAHALISALAAPCGSAGSPISPRIMADSGHTASLANATALRRMLPVRDAVTPRWLPAALLVVALTLLLVEWVLRRRDQPLQEAQS